jgi:Mg-chelatase subunit ChlD
MEKTKSVIRLTQHNAIVVVPVSQTSTKVEVNLPVNHLIAIDCSGSMYSELPKIREQLKSKLQVLVKEQDSVTIIAFSGRGECATLIKDEKIATLKDVTKVHGLIDRYVTPQGLTSFYEPLKAIETTIDEINRNGEAYSFLFLTDGYDNQSSQGDLIKLAEALESKVTNAIFVEYGYYCNTNLLNKLAETVGGQVVFSKDFKEYEPVFVNYITKNLTSGKKIDLKLREIPKHGLVFSLSDGEVTVYKVSDSNNVLVPENLASVFYLADPTQLSRSVNDMAINLDAISNKVDGADNQEVLNYIYSVLYVLMQRAKTDDVYNILGEVGDVELIQEYSNAIGKQSLARVQAKVLDILNGNQKPYAKGYQPNLVPDANAFCILDLFELLSSDDKALWFPSHPSFSYNAIGSKKVQASSLLSNEEVEQVQALLDELISSKSVARAGELTKLISEIQKGKFQLKFEPKESEKGHKINTMVWNESRPNLSFLIKQDGTVALPENQFGLKEVETFRYRNYTFIKDGIVNVEKMFVSMSIESYTTIFNEAPQILMIEGAVVPFVETGEVGLVLDLTKIPVINRSMVKEVSAEELFRNQHNLLTLKGYQSVFNYYNKIYNPKVSESFVAAYSVEAAEWLKSIGITDYNGFAPKVTDEKIGEKYMAKEMVVKIKGISSLPTVKDVVAKLEAGKALTPREEVLRPALKTIEKFVESIEGESDDEITKAFGEYIDTMKAGVTEQTRKLNAEIAKTKFGIILGQTWFKEFETMDENHLLLEIDGRSYDFSVDIIEKEIEI